MAELELVVVAADAAATAQTVLDRVRTLMQLVKQISALAATLADPPVWDGAGAERFRTRQDSLIDALRTAGQGLETTASTALTSIQRVDAADTVSPDAAGPAPAPEVLEGFVPAVATPAEGQPMVPPGAGSYYKNDTPIDIPPEMAEDNRPLDTNWLWKYGHDQLGLLAGENRADTVLTGTLMYLWAEKYTNADALLFHWLYGDGSAYQIDPAQMMKDVPSFNDNVQAQVAQGVAKDGTFDSGWLSDSVANHQPMNTTGEHDWFYAMNGYQYRVVGTPVTVGGAPYMKVTTYVFKRYNWGNPDGGGARLDIVRWGIHWLNQNDAAQLNADGEAHDFNVWGENTRLVPLTGQAPRQP